MILQLEIKSSLDSSIELGSSIRELIFTSREFSLLLFFKEQLKSAFNKIADEIVCQRIRREEQP